MNSNFLVLGSRSCLKQFISNKNFVGGIFVNKKDKDFNYSFDSIPENVKTIHIEFRDPFLNHFMNTDFNHKEYKIIFFTHKNEEIIVEQTDLLEFKPLSVSIVKNIVSKYKDVNFYTFGQTGFMDVYALVSIVLNHFSNTTKKLVGMEVGSWLGCSSYFIGSAMKHINNDSNLFCVDLWKSWPRDYSIKDYRVYDKIDMFSYFYGLMDSFDILDNIKPMRMFSDSAFEIVGKDQLDLIFIDGNHTYKGVYRDVLYAIKCTKIGGIVMGHDCGGYPKDFPEQFLLENKHKEQVEFKGKDIFCGVIQVLKELFGNDFKIFKGSLVWYKTVDQNDKLKAEKLLNLLEK